MTAPASWPPSLPHPVMRGQSWNTLQDLTTQAYRLIQPGEHVMGLLVRVKDGEGRGTLIVRDENGIRRVPVHGVADAGEAGAA